MLSSTTRRCALGFAIAGAFVASAINSPAAPPTPTCDGLSATIVGTNGDDTINGTAGPDVIVGLAGDDRIRGDRGRDVICGGTGDDTLSGSGEDDRLFGEHGADVLDGGEGGCCVHHTNTGDDYLSGGQGDDRLHTADFPTTGNTLHGDEGNDQLFAWSGGWVHGDNGEDVIRQYTGDSRLEGGNGQDDILDWDDSRLRNEHITMVGDNGGDRLRSEDSTSIVDMDGGNGPDTCLNGDTAANCEA